MRLSSPSWGSVLISFATDYWQVGIIGMEREVLIGSPDEDFISTSYDKSGLASYLTSFTRGRTRASMVCYGDAG
jgi:hypothetical protein